MNLMPGNICPFCNQVHTSTDCPRRNPMYMNEAAPDPNIKNEADPQFKLPYKVDVNEVCIQHFRLRLENIVNASKNYLRSCSAYHFIMGNEFNRPEIQSDYFNRMIDAKTKLEKLLKEHDDNPVK